MAGLCHNLYQVVNSIGYEEENSKLDITQIPDDSDEGYILEVDLKYPKELLDLHNDYSPVPEKMKICPEMLSPYCKQLSEDLKLGSVAVPKLVHNLNDKTKYIVHYRNLKLYLGLRIDLAEIHSVLAFQQSPWPKAYIDFNTERRKHAANDFEKDFYKLMNNAVFGKTMKNLRKRVNVKFVSDKTKLKKRLTRPSFNYNSFSIFSEDLAAVNMKKTKFYLNRSIYVGFTVKKIRHDNYKTCLFDKKQTKTSMNQIRSHGHEIYSIKLNKIALSPYDDKRYIFEGGVNTLAHGHYKIMK